MHFNIRNITAGNFFKTVFIALIAFLFLFIPYISFDFGITCDEFLHQTHGKFLLQHLNGENDMSVHSPFTADGKLPPLNSETPLGATNWSRMNIYGGSFDLASNFLFQLFPFIGEYETRHFLGSLVGVFAILFSGLLAKELGGWRAGLLAIVFLSASPRFIAHSMNNPKDLPFAAMFIFSLYHIILFLKEYPEIKMRRIIFLSLGISLAISVRVSGILLICFLVLFSSGNILSVFFKKIISKDDLKKMAKYFSVTLVICFLGYIGVWLFWPYARNASFFYPVFVLKEMSNFDIFDSYNLFAGKWIHRWEIPWDYIPQWIWVTIPLFISSGIFLFPFIFINKFKRIHQISNKFFLLIVVAIIFPMLFVIINKSNVLDEYRHLLFIYLPLVVLCALSWEAVIKISNKKLIFSLFILLTIFISEPLFWMKKNHPNECAYFSPLIGGPDGAFKKYETDYWGNSIRLAVEWIGENKKPVHENDTIGIMEWYIRGISASYYISKYKHLKHVQASPGSDQWDYWIYLASAAKHKQDILLNWPPPGTIHEIKADNTPLCAIMVNKLKRPEEYAFTWKKKTELQPTAENYFQTGIAFYRVENYEESMNAFQNAIRINPEYELAYNNMATCYLELKRWDNAIEACSMALEINPALDIARNNLNYAKSMKYPEEKVLLKNTAELKLKATKLVNLSVEYYNKKEYQRCIDTCKMALEFNPVNATAYNNICICQYLLGNYEQAEKSCKKALKINPEFELAKNNLKMVEEKLYGKSKP